MLRRTLSVISVVAVVLAGPATLLAPLLTTEAHAQSSNKKAIRKLEKKITRLNRQRRDTNIETQNTFPGRLSVKSKIRRTETNIGIIKSRRDDLNAAIRKAKLA